MRRNIIAFAPYNQLTVVFHPFNTGNLLTNKLKLRGMSGKKLVTESKMSKRVVKKNTKAIGVFKSYDSIRKQMDEIQIAAGKKRTYHTNSSSTKNSRIDFDGIGSTQNFSIDTRLA